MNFVGRAIDAIAQECKVANNNNQSNAPKLRLFDKSTGEILSRNLATTIESLLNDRVILEGSDLILAYVGDDCVQLNTNK